MKTALISVYDKTNLLSFAKFLTENQVQLISTGGTYKYLKENGLKVLEVSQVTGFEEILDGRVKTLHPCIHAGILAIRDNEQHMEKLKEKEISTIDMVVVNLYPFFQKAEENIKFEEKIEFIDIGGPSMLRAAAKNFRDVAVLSDIRDYEKVMDEIKGKGEISFDTRKMLAGKVFNLTSAYDAAISNFLLEDNYPEFFTLSYKKAMDLRYGENPHQAAAYYEKTCGKGAMKEFKQLQGKELSYNNIKDMDIAWKVVNEFEETACCALKHNTPCGVAIGESVKEAYAKAYACDDISIFGGIVAFNKTVDKCAAEELVKIFLEVIIAPGFETDALEILSAKKNLRIISCSVIPQGNKEIVAVDGGLLVQDSDNRLMEELNYVTDAKPSQEELKDLIFGMKVVKYVKSNAIVVVKNGMAKGIAGGQTNRIWSAAQALDRAKNGAVLASDAFFPFGDVVEEAAKYNIKAIIQPGGSVRDEESIQQCNKHNIAMVFTGIRHFKH